MLLRSRLSAVLVRADRDVLGPVVCEQGRAHGAPAPRARTRLPQRRSHGHRLTVSSGVAPGLRPRFRRSRRAHSAARTGSAPAGSRASQSAGARMTRRSRSGRAGPACACAASVRGAACVPTRRAGRRSGRAPRSPTTSAHGRERRSAAPSLRAERVPQPRSYRSCEVAERRLEHISGGPTPDRAAVDLDERHELPHRRRRERLRPRPEVARADRRPLRPRSRSRAPAPGPSHG